MTDKFERQLKQLLNGSPEEVNSELDGLPEDDEEKVIELTPVIFEEKESSLTLNDNQDLNDDYKFARSNYYGLIGRTNAAIDLAMKISAMSEHPRAIEVLATLMKTSSDITKDLLSLQKNIKEETKTNDKTKGTYIQNNHFYGKDEVKDIDSQLDDLEE